MDKNTKLWKCDKCGWEERAHPKYGWQPHNTHAVKVHQTILCPSLNT